MKKTYYAEIVKPVYGGEPHYSNCESDRYEFNDMCERAKKKSDNKNFDYPDYTTFFSNVKRYYPKIFEGKQAKILQVVKYTDWLRDKYYTLVFYETY